MMRKILSIGMLFLLITPARGQQNQPAKIGCFGFSMSVDYVHLHLSTLGWDRYKIDDKMNSLKATDKIGFSLGLVYLIDLNENFALRPQTVIAFQSNVLHYDFVQLEDHTEKIQPVAIELPVHFIYTDRKDKYFMPSLLMGLRYVRGLGGNIGNNKLSLENNNFSFDIGGGLDVRLKKITIRPELMVAMTMRGMNSFKNDIYHKAISGMSKEKYLFSITFTKNKKHSD